MKFSWCDLLEKNYTSDKDKLYELIDNCIGSIRVGEICIDVIIRDYGIEKGLAYSFDFYIANEDTGYGYKGDIKIPYDYVDGIDLFNLSLSYNDFVKESEKIIKEFIEVNDKNVHNYSLVEKANKPLLIW